MKRVQMKYVIVLFVLVLAWALVYGWSIAARGFSAKDEPSSAEAFVARRLRRIAMPRAARELQNPVENTRKVIEGAMAHYADHCAGCHGNDGRGATLVGRGLYPKPPDMTQDTTQQLSDGELYYIIENGVRFTGMPGFGEEAGNQQDKETWALIHFIRHLPHITEEELVQMKQINPKSPMELAKEERMRKFLEGDDSAPPESSHEHHH
jgi:mono/diheme cytochrome c family protein